jgi:hypothetical protein
MVACHRLMMAMRQLYNVCVCAVVDPHYLDAMTMDDVRACRCVLLQIDAQLALDHFSNFLKQGI